MDLTPKEHNQVSCDDVAVGDDNFNHSNDYDNDELTIICRQAISSDYFRFDL